MMQACCAAQCVFRQLDPWSEWSEARLYACTSSVRHKEQMMGRGLNMGNVALFSSHLRVRELAVALFNMAAGLSKVSPKADPI